MRGRPTLEIVNCERIVRRLSDERGMALVMAIGLMTVLFVFMTTTMYFAGRNQSASYYSRDTQVSYSLAEAGLNSAMSRLYAASDPLDSSAVPSTTETIDGGTTTYSGSLSGNIWTLTATSSVRNPTGTVPIARTVSQQVEVIPGNPDIWAFNYSDTTSGCMRVNNNATISAPLYVRGNLCIAPNAHITGSPLQVEGTLDIGNNGSVGYPSAPIAEAKLKGGCLSGPHPCSSADDVYASAISTTTDGHTKPPVNFANWYQNANPGPMHGCTIGSVPGGFDNNGAMDSSRPTFDLLTSTPYSCTTSRGRLTWVPGNPGALTISGTIFFDGGINVSGSGVYSGMGTIYANGSVSLSNNAKLCGIAGCNASWNTALNVLMFVAGKPTGFGFDLSNNSVYQGAAYVVAKYHAQNNSTNWGPVIADQLQIDNNAGQTIPLVALPPGAPSGTTTLQLVPGSYSG